MDNFPAAPSLKSEEKSPHHMVSVNICAVTADTDIDDALIVADEQVAEDAGLVEVAQADHVLHPVDGGRVHGLDVGGILRRNPVFLCEEGTSRRRFNGFKSSC